MKGLSVAKPLDCRHGPACHFGGEYETRRHQPDVHENRACTTVAGRAAFFRSRQSDDVAKGDEQIVLRLAEKLRRLTIDTRRHMQLGHMVPRSLESMIT